MCVCCVRTCVCVCICSRSDTRAYECGLIGGNKCILCNKEILSFIKYYLFQFIIIILNITYFKFLLRLNLKVFFKSLYLLFQLNYVFFRIYVENIYFYIVSLEQYFA